VVTQQAVPAQRGGAAAALQRATHQRLARGLVARVVREQALDVAGLAQQRQVLVAQALACGIGPRFVARLGQQLANVKRGRTGALRDVAPPCLQRRVGSGLEGECVDLHRAPWKQKAAAAAQHHGPRITERLACMVRGLAQVGAPRLGVEVRPQRVDHLFVQQAATGLQRQQLHQFRSAAAAPAVDGSCVAIDRQREAAEKLHPDPAAVFSVSRHPPLCLSAARGRERFRNTGDGRCRSRAPRALDTASTRSHRP
jgi:hypothetical protein